MDANRAAGRAAINPALRRAYDLRGTVGSELTAADAHALGLAFAALARSRGLSRLAVGRDGRLSSPELQAAVVEGLVAGGMQVWQLPLGPTPLLSFAIFRLSLHGGVAVTGSHNPPDQNGFKLLLGGKPLYGQELDLLWQAAPDRHAGGALRQVDPSGAYIDALAAELAGLAGSDACWDSGNGATGAIVERLVRHLPGRHTTIHTRVDGRFPNHHPDPADPANMADLQRECPASGCALGFAFDGDGDRLGAVDETGAIVWPDQLLLLLARDALQERPGSAIVGDVKSSSTLFDGIAAAGGVPVMGPSGYVRVRERMLQEAAPLAGEMSGHIFFADRWHGSDDALYVAVRVLSALARSGRSLRQFRESLPPTAATPEIRLPCPDDRKAAVLGEIADRLRARGARVERVDGLRVAGADGWWLLRASGTEPKLTGRCESRSAAGLQRLKREVARELRACGVAPGAFDSRA